MSAGTYLVYVDDAIWAMLELSRGELSMVLAFVMIIYMVTRGGGQPFFPVPPLQISMGLEPAQA